MGDVTELKDDVAGLKGSVIGLKDDIRKMELANQRRSNRIDVQFEDLRAFILIKLR